MNTIPEGGQSLHVARLPVFRIGAGVAAAIIWFALAECPNEGAHTSNRTRACQNCASGEQAADQSSCSYSVSSALIYCDCEAGKKCDETGNSVPNLSVTQYTDGQCVTGVCHGGDATTVLVTGKEKQSTQCST